MTNTNKIIAEILVSEGYAVAYKFMENYPDENGMWALDKGGWPEDKIKWVGCNPFADDTLEARKQLDVLENYLIKNGYHREIQRMLPINLDSAHKWRKACIKLCLEHTNKGTGGQEGE